MLITNVRQQKAIGRAAAAAGGYFELARRLSEVQSDHGSRGGHDRNPASATSEDSHRQR